MLTPPTDIRIGGIGTYIPSGRASNSDRLEFFGLTDEFLRTKLGVASRAIKSDDEQPSDLCVKALEELRARTSIDLSQVQICCVVTQNPDKSVPHTAAIVHSKLGLAKPCMTFDLSQGCAGYVHGLAVMTSLMASLRLDHALLFTADPYSKIINPEDKSTALIFGDAATVTYLVRGGPGYALVDASFGTEPGGTKCLVVESAMSALEKGEPAPRLQMDGAAVLYYATRSVPPNIRDLLARNGLTVNEIDRFLLHPGSLRVVELLKKELNLPTAKVPVEIHDHGNTISSSIPLLLKQDVIDKSARRLLLSGFGVGFTWGSCVLELRDHGN